VVKRTLIRPKPNGEAMEFSVPPLINEELWLRANQATRGRGRGRGKEGKAISALVRNRIFCPRCGKPLVVRRISGSDRHYYFCSRLVHASATEHCAYRRFIPGTWDEVVWDCISAILKDESWIQERLAGMEKQCQDIERLVKLEQLKILQAQNKINKVREGFEGGLYSLDEAKAKVNEYQNIINKAEPEVKRLTDLIGERESNVDIEGIREELRKLAQENLEQATFTDKREIINKLGIKIYPAEDLKSMKIRCSLSFGDSNSCHESDKCAIIQFGSLRSQ